MKRCAPGSGPSELCSPCPQERLCAPPCHKARLCAPLSSPPLSSPHQKAKSRSQLSSPRPQERLCSPCSSPCPQARRRSPRAIGGQSRCTIWLPDDVLTLIASFISWDDAFASRYRGVCRAFQFGIDMTARGIAQQPEAMLRARFKRHSTHFGPADVQPLCVRNVAPGRRIDGSWRLLMLQVFGQCACCGSSTRWMYACSEKSEGCDRRICVTCLESGTSCNLAEGRYQACCSQWVCGAHSSKLRLRKCVQCKKTCCLECLQPSQPHHRATSRSSTPRHSSDGGRRSKSYSLYCAECSAWDSDTDF